MKPHDSDSAPLSPAQRAALRYVQAVVQRGEVVVRPRVLDLLERAGCGAHSYTEAIECVRAHARSSFTSSRTALAPKPQLWLEVLQHLKQLWHVLVHYGVPAGEQNH